MAHHGSRSDDVTTDGTPNNGLLLRLVTEGNQDYYERGFEDAAGANPPKLIVTYGSMPYTGQLSVIPSAASGGKRRRWISRDNAASHSRSA